MKTRLTIKLPRVNWTAQVQIDVVSKDPIPSLYTHGSVSGVCSDVSDRTGMASGMRYVDIGSFLRAWNAAPANATAVAIVNEIQAEADSYFARCSGGVR